jgi:predicted phage terminase large subunit-like protein
MPIATFQDPRLADERLLRLAAQRCQHRRLHPERTVPWPGGQQDAATVALRERCRRVWPADSPYYTPDQPMGLELFALTFFPDYCTHPFNPMHQDLFARHEHRLATGERGWRDATAAPRESAKTTWYKIQIIHDVVYQHERYIGIGSANFDQARDKVKDIRDVFIDNVELRRVYGPQETDKWTEADFITQTGVRVRALTPRSKVRGFVWGRYRPTKILIDDVEDPELVLTPLRRERLLQWLQSDIAKLGAQDLNLAVIGTILHPESMLSTLLHNPGFTTRIYQAVLQFAGHHLPEDDPRAVAITQLWAQWRDLVLALEDDERFEHAQAFYRAHEAQMLEGAQVFWPEAQPYVYLMFDRLIFGEQAFFQERQNEPRGDRRYIFDMDHALWVRLADDGLVRNDGTLIHFLDLVSLAAYWDPTPDRQARTSDYTCCVIAAKDKYNYVYVLDCYCAQEPSTDVAMDAIVAMLWHWHVSAVGLEANGFQSLLTGELRRKIAAKAQQAGQPWDVTFLPVKNMRNKVLRIKSLDPLVANGWLGFAESLPPAFVQQFVDFLPVDGANKFDDAPDATEGVLRVLGGLFDRRAAF